MRLYQNDHLATEISDKDTRHILWSQDIAIAQLEQAMAANMLQVDQANCVLGMASDSIAYSPFGHFERSNSTALLAFNGQRFDLIIKGYALGNGYRIYYPNLARFGSPDTLSPFSRGGLNAYSYCEGDPINRADPSGHFSLLKPRTWFRSSNKKVKQRTKALDDMRPTLEETTKVLSNNHKKYRRTYDLEDLHNVKAARKNLFEIVPIAVRKHEGIKKYRPDYQNETVEAAVATLISTKIETPKYKATKDTKSWFDHHTPKDDQYDDANYIRKT